jgi:type I restriction enzyme S subunit
MNIEKQKQNAPALRFPEFSGDWEEKKLGKVTKIASGGTPNRGSNNFWDNGDIPWVTTSLIDFNEIFHVNEYITHQGLANSSAKLFPKDTILVAMYGQGKTRGRAAILKIEASTNQACAALLPNVGFCSDFLLQYITNNYENLRRLSNDGGQKNLSSGLINNLRVALPLIPEQQKIASFLSSVDKKIEKLSKKKKLLERYKKGMMQELFTQQIRFKDDNGNDYPDWEEKKLEDVAIFLKGKGLAKSDIDENGALECIRYGQLYTDYAETIKGVKSRTSVSASELVLSKANDIIIPASGETQIDIATASCVLKEGVALGGDLNIIRTEQHGVFLSYYLNSVRKIDIARLSQGISVVHLYASQLKTLKLELPSFPEQTKIANFLSAIDDKINLIEAELTQVQTFKKGLLQQMFV